MQILTHHLGEERTPEEIPEATKCIQFIKIHNPLIKSSIISGGLYTLAYFSVRKDLPRSSSDTKEIGGRLADLIQA